MKSALFRIIRVITGQAAAFLPDLINAVAGTALPVIPPPYNFIIGAVLNGMAKALRDRNARWTWIPV